MINRILVCSDILATKEKEQASNRRWLVDLLRRPIKEATGIDITSYGSSLANIDSFSRTQFFSLSNITLDINATQFWYDDEDITRESLAYLHTHIQPTDLIIGYELSNQTRRIFDRMGVEWVDIWLHPIRFLDDILFGFSSSNSNVYKAMSNFHVDEDVFQLYADRSKIQYYKGYKRPDLPIKAGSALFIGQTLEDKAVCCNGKMLNLLNFKDEFEAAGFHYGKVYYSRHPYVKSGDEAILKYIKTCRFAQLVEFPAYEMFASGRLSKVFSVSSSAVFEAKYFGLETEFLSSPVIRYGTLHGEEYISIYQEFVSPHFWADVLAPLLPTNPCNRVMFFDRKDKLRDMLNFYWNYQYVDKTENIRQTLLAVDRKVQSLFPKTPEAKKAHRSTEIAKIKVIPGQPWSVTQTEVEELMTRHSVISFDIFDTLIERPFEHPSDLFAYLEPEVRDITGRQTLSFQRYRQEARGYVTDGKHGEEITLSERYRALASELGFPENMAVRLQALEEAAEIRFCRPRQTGRMLYEAGLRLGKRIVLLSDCYFDEKFMEKLLETNGFDRHEATILSSVEGFLKHTGRLYPILEDRLKVKANQILHIGDNAQSDVKQAQAAGLSTYHLPRAAESFAKKSRLSGAQFTSDPVLRSVMRGLISNRLVDNPIGLTTPSHVGEEPGNLGYAVAGPIFFGFAKWVLEKAINDGIDTLYFLSRDGEIVKRCYDILSSHYPNAPQSVYLRASRRGVNVPALRSEQDIMAMLEVNFSPVSIGKLANDRFGLSIIPPSLLACADYKNIDDIADFKKDEKKLRYLFSLLAPTILSNATCERKIMLRYFKSMGLFNTEKRALVDIGHNGTLQRSISRLISDPSLGGYYFVTYKEIQKEVISQGMPAVGYLADQIDGVDTRHPYCKYLLMFEVLFLNTEGTFVRMVEHGNELNPVLVNSREETERIEFISRVHDAAVEFCRDVTGCLAERLKKMKLDGDSAISGYISLLRNPTAVDATLFKGIQIENMYSGRDNRALVQPLALDGDAAATQSIWMEGTKVLSASMVMPSASPKWFGHRILEKIIRHTTSKKKYRKFIRSPQLFFKDSKLPIVRALAIIVKDAR